MSVGADGEPGGLTAERAAWLDHHLRHTGVPDDPAHLLKPGWRPAYRLATGGDAAYLSALREVSRQFLELARADPAAGGDATWPRARAAIARLLHAHIGELAGNQPVDALVADALLGQAATALRQAACRPDPEDAARARSSTRWRTVRGCRGRWSIWRPASPGGWGTAGPGSSP
jgi:hypothetical protein